MSEAASAETSAILLDQADRLFRQHVTKERLAEADGDAWPAAIWDAVVAAGLPLAMVPEAHGGVGLPAAEAMQLVCRSAWHTLPLPLAETMLAAALWAEAGGGVVAGALSLAPANPDDNVTICGQGAGYVLAGTARGVPWGNQVGHVLVLARDESGAAFLALLPRPGQNAAPHRNLAFEPRETLKLDGTELPAESVRPAGDTCADGMPALGALVRAQQMVGAMERCLDYALDYANQRKQFGRPIGKFQAVQHMLAEGAGHYAAAAAAAEMAAQAFGTPDFGFAVAVAKARAGEAAGKVAEVAHQVHGAMGFTQEHPLHFATRRLWSWRDEFGNEAYWQERIGRLVCARGGDALWPLLVGA
ncbi:MAG: acyl-CoA/acyl-ACP dehydrogenase [Alphaproteobacteria bacterium]|nr:acyl-CoA/acyl-ACP dehydrogenase [Alphaproteobacteria bacterium]